MKLLLIDKRVRHSKLIEALRPNVDYILFDYYSDTYATLIEKIIEKNKNYSDVALVQHSTLRPYYQICSKEKQLMLNEEAPYDSYDDFLNFVKDLKTLVNLQRFDMLACSLYYHVNFKGALEWLEKEIGIDLRASTNFTGNSENGGDWIMESDNVDIRANYFTDGIVNFKELLYSITNGSMFNSNKLIKDVCGNVIYLQKDIYGNPIYPKYDFSGNPLYFPESKVINWGYGDELNTQSINNFISSTVANDLSAGIVNIYTNGLAFAALTKTGRVITWGDSGYGGDSTVVKNDISSNIISIYSNAKAFAALSKTGRVITWGDSYYGGDSSSVKNDISSNVIHVYSNAFAFAALTKTGRVITWGGSPYGGDSSSVANDLSSNVVAIYNVDVAFAALTKTGRVITWGDSGYGGDSSLVANDISSNIRSIYSNADAFAALTETGRVITWGPSYTGGDSSLVANDLSANVVSICSTQYAFAALTNAGKVITWGDPAAGGDSSTTSGGTGTSNALQSGVIRLYSTQSAFAALRSTRRVTVWGNEFEGGALTVELKTNLSPNIVSVYSSAYGFTALSESNLIYSWGSALSSFDVNTGEPTIESIVNASNTTNFIAVYPNVFKFSGIKTSGQLVTWGTSSLEPNFSSVQADLSRNILAVCTSVSAFAALKPVMNINYSDFYYSTGALKISALQQYKLNLTPNEPPVIIQPLTATLSNLKSILYNNDSTTITIAASQGTTPYTYTWYQTISGEAEQLISVSPPQYITINNNNLTMTNLSIFKRNTSIIFRCQITDSSVPPSIINKDISILFIGYEPNVEVDIDILFEGSSKISIRSAATNFDIPFNNQTRTIQADVSGGTLPFNYRLTNLTTSSVIQTILNSTSRNFSYPLTNNYTYLSDTVQRYKVDVSDAFNSADISFNVRFKAYPDLILSPQLSSLSLISPNSLSLQIIASGGVGQYSYEWSRRESTEQISITVQSPTTTGVNSSTYNISSLESATFANKIMIYTVIVKDSSTPQLQKTATFTLTISSPPQINVGLTINGQSFTSPITLNYNNDSKTIIANVNGGSLPYIYKWVERLTPNTELFETSGVSFEISNNYAHVSTDVTKNYEMYFEDSSSPPQKKFFTFSVIYKAYKPIAANQNILDTTISLNSQLVSLQITGVSGGKSADIITNVAALYIYNWSKSAIYYDLSAINFSQLYTTLNYASFTYAPLIQSNEQIYSINQGTVQLHNNEPYTEGHPRVIIYKCEITDALNTTPLTKYFKVFYDAFYAITPCFDGDVSVKTKNGLIKVKDLKKTDILINPSKNSEYSVTDIFMKTVNINPADINNSLYTIQFGPDASESYLSTAIINKNELLYEYLPTSRFASSKTNVSTTRVMYHIFTNEFITRDVFTANGLQIKSYGSPSFFNTLTQQEEQYLRQDNVLNGLYFNYLFADTLPDKNV
jgi:hypothetical protein